MLQKIADFFNTKINVDVPQTDSDSADRIALATCALLLEMAHADSHFTDEEKSTIISVLKSNFSLSDNNATELLDLADMERKESHDLWQFTNLINENFSRDEKIKVIEVLWSVIYADGKVDMHEEYLMRKLNVLLNLDHKDMIDAKIRMRDE